MTSLNCTFFVDFLEHYATMPLPNDNVIVWKNFCDERHFCNFHFWHANEVECHSSNNSLLLSSAASLLRRRIEESIKMPSLCTSTKFVWAPKKKKKENDSSARKSSPSLIKLVVKRNVIRFLQSTHMRYHLGLVYKSG